MNIFLPQKTMQISLECDNLFHRYNKKLRTSGKSHYEQLKYLVPDYCTGYAQESIYLWIYCTDYDQGSIYRWIDYWIQVKDLFIDGFIVQIMIKDNQGCLLMLCSLT